MNGMVLLVVTLLSSALAVVMSVVAWRAGREERQRAEARILALAAEIHDDSGPTPEPLDTAPPRPPIDIRTEAPRRDPAPPRPAPASIMPVRPIRPVVPATKGLDDLPLRDAPVAAVPARGELFAATDAAAPSGLRFAAVAAVGILAVGTAAALAVVLSTGPRTAPAKPVAAPTIGNTDAETVPLELVALGHDRDGDRLTVRGVVRNPAAGAPVDRLVAIVFVFNREGGFVTSAHAAVEALRPGGESRFVVTLASAGDISRYRVSFRTDERVVSHIDKRDRSALARAQSQ
jgi:hypothetical protein